MSQEPLMLVTHARGDEKFDNGILSEKIPEAVKNFPGTTAHISMQENTPRVQGGYHPPYGGEELFDIHVRDEYHGTISEEHAEKLLDYDPIVRAGTQYRGCASNTDVTLSAVAEDKVNLNYFTDLTVALDESDRPHLLQEEEDYSRRDSVNIRGNLDIRYGEFGL
ncbi:hypothetical protein [Candidatus Nanohalobium constans]|uniref:Uncharacterized protein n=1 Tax=Candidatus Nanohalobium constans TaxID=2565781 RepID=A0A5Q0UH93_9ARCH|nr:hypothetical protein [Candidatus Nanohalobium constans]QGA81008.1 hypothetical protein LC1Nh_1141 [Candidatus Nanohalobium constans]